MFGLPTTGTPPFCPSEVRGSVAVDRGAPFWRRLLVFLGPGLLISVGYVDPGNWATDIEAGSKLGFGLLWVVLLASLAAMPRPSATRDPRRAAPASRSSRPAPARRGPRAARTKPSSALLWEMKSWVMA
jgi:hypothetical protein